MTRRTPQSRSLRSQTLAAIGFVLAAGGLTALACSSDTKPGTGDGTPGPFPSDSTDGMSSDGNGSDGNGSDGNGSDGNGESPNASGNDDGLAPDNAADGNGNAEAPDEDLGLDEGQPDDPQGGGNDEPAGDDPGTDDPGTDDPGGDDPGTDDPPGQDPPQGLAAPNCEPAAGPVPNLALTQVAGGMTRPVYVTGVPGDDSRLFVLEQRGVVRVIENGQLQQQAALDINGQTGGGQNEQGLLGLAFHPNYAENGRLYLHYSNNGGDGVVAEYTIDDGNRNQINPNSERVLFTINQPQQNHNGGQLTFGPDGMLFIGFGDGGGQNDQHGNPGNGQSLNTLLAKILRVDVDGNQVNGAYGIPPGNMGQGAAPEIWAYGLRNPWRFSFDPCSGDLYIGDVGQNAQEEVDFLPAGTPAGSNFGWRITEGDLCGPDGNNCNRNGLIEPVDTYGRQVGQSVTGGYVYRGSDIPGFRGYYLYADYQQSVYFRFRIQNRQAVDRQQVNLNAQGRPSSFGQDNAGEIYVTSFNGGVWRLTAN